MVGFIREVTDFARHSINYLLGKTGHRSVEVVAYEGYSASSTLGFILSDTLYGADPSLAERVWETHDVAKN